MDVKGTKSDPDTIATRSLMLDIYMKSCNAVTTQCCNNSIQNVVEVIELVLKKGIT